MEDPTIEMPEADWDLSRVSDDVWRYNTAELLRQVEDAGTTDSIAVEVNGNKTSLIVLHTIGAKTGEIRRTPVIRVEHDGIYAAVASKGGALNNPAWYHNAVANPHVTVQDGENFSAHTARPASDEERGVWWERAVSAWPAYAEYATKTDRYIPVLVLEPTAR